MGIGITKGINTGRGLAYMKDIANMTPEEVERERIKAIRRLQAREWRKNNPEKVKAAKERHFLKKAREWEAENGKSII